MSGRMLRIQDIQTTELLYYDPDYVADCYRFCLERDIDCLPAIDGTYEFYLRNDEAKAFDRQSITLERRLSGFTFIFQPDLIEHFRKAEVQFVYEHEELTGVVHFCDYNRPEVGTYLYALLSDYERSLRELALRSKLSNNDMRDFFEKGLLEAPADSKDRGHFARRLGLYDRFAEERQNAPPLRTFYLDDLIGLLNDRRHTELNPSVVRLRNRVMHAREVVELVDASAPDYIFDFQSFEEFFGLVQTLLRDATRVRNRIAFLGGLEEIGRPP